MTRLAGLGVLVAAGCLSSSEVGEPLDENVYCLGVPSAHSSAAACLAQSAYADARDCSFALALCHNGRAALRIGGLVLQGIYAMDDGVARGTIEAHDLALDLATLSEPEGPIVRGIRWERDSEGRAQALLDSVSCD